VRDSDHPWGSPGLGAKKEARLCLESFRYRVCVFLLFHALMVCGGLAAIQHPALPVGQPRYATGWTLPEIQELENHPAVQVVDFNQSELGQVATLPTWLI
jgi:hypothetical protein